MKKNIVKGNVFEKRDQISKKDFLEAFGKRSIAYLSFFIVILFFTVLIQGLTISSLWKKYAETDRLTVVKLDPQGTWHIDYYKESEINYFESTLRSVLYQHVERCYSKNKATIIEDWTICANMLDYSIQENFIERYSKSPDGDWLSAFEVANEFIKSSNENYIVEPYQWDFIGDIPNTKTDPSKIFNTIIFADINKNSQKPKKSRVSIKFRFLNKIEMMKLGSMLNYNPIGIQVVQQKIIEETK